jgi:hypothetical protein
MNDEKYFMQAAELGHLGVYQLMAETVEDKNPRVYWHHPTPLHKAAATWRSFIYLSIHYQTHKEQKSRK